MASVRWLVSDGKYNAGEIAGEGVGLTREQMEEAVASGRAEWHKPRPRPSAGEARSAPAKGVPEPGKMQTKGGEATEARTQPHKDEGQGSKAEEDAEPAQDGPLSENSGAQSQGSGRTAPSSSRPRGRRSTGTSSSSSGSQGTASS